MTLRPGRTTWLERGSLSPRAVLLPVWCRVQAAGTRARGCGVLLDSGPDLTQKFAQVCHRDLVAAAVHRDSCLPVRWGVGLFSFPQCPPPWVEVFHMESVCGGRERGLSSCLGALLCWSPVPVGIQVQGFVLVHFGVVHREPASLVKPGFCQGCSVLPSCEPAGSSLPFLELVVV